MERLLSLSLFFIPQAIITRLPQLLCMEAMIIMGGLRMGTMAATIGDIMGVPMGETMAVDIMVDTVGVGTMAGTPGDILMVDTVGVDIVAECMVEDIIVETMAVGIMAEEIMAVDIGDSWV